MAPALPYYDSMIEVLTTCGQTRTLDPLKAFLKLNPDQYEGQYNLTQAHIDRIAALLKELPDLRDVEKIHTSTGESLLHIAPSRLLEKHNGFEVLTSGDPSLLNKPGINGCSYSRMETIARNGDESLFKLCHEKGVDIFAPDAGTGNRHDFFAACHNGWPVMLYLMEQDNGQMFQKNDAGDDALDAVTLAFMEGWGRVHSSNEYAAFVGLYIKHACKLPQAYYDRRSEAPYCRLPGERALLERIIDGPEHALFFGCGFYPYLAGGKLPGSLDTLVERDTGCPMKKGFNSTSHEEFDIPFTEPVTVRQFMIEQIGDHITRRLKELELPQQEWDADRSRGERPEHINSERIAWEILQKRFQERYPVIVKG